MRIYFVLGNYYKGNVLRQERNVDTYIYILNVVQGSLNGTVNTYVTRFSGKGRTRKYRNRVSTVFFGVEFI